MSPDVIVSNPAIMRSVVVLPQPDGPRKAMNSPFDDLEIEVDDCRRAVVIDLADTDELEIESHAPVPNILLDTLPAPRALGAGSRCCDASSDDA